MTRALFALLFILIGPALSGCDTLNSYGIGGEPELVCKYRDGTAAIDDRIAGKDAMHGSMIRRFKDADELCAKLKAAPPPFREPASAAVVVPAGAAGAASAVSLPLVK